MNLTFKNILNSRAKIILFLLALAGCGLSPKLSEADNQPVKIKKTIKDVNYRNATAFQGFKKKIAILPFIDVAPEKRLASTRENARKAFINELETAGQYLIASDDDLKDILKNDLSKFQSQNQYDLKKIAQELHKKGISSIIEGQIRDVRLKDSSQKIGVVRSLKAVYEVEVRLRILNVRTENEVYNTVKTVTLEEENLRLAERVMSDQFFVKNPELVEILVKDAFLDFTPQIQDALVDITWEGRIAAIRSEKIYLNVGRISGVRIGDILKVVEDSSEIYDPEIGYHLGKVPGRVKGTLEIISYFGQDGAVATVHSGAGFKESDRVEAY